MAMTKAEQAAMEALRVRCALAWPAKPPKPIEIDVALAASETKWARAWWFNAYTREVGEGVFTSVYHAREPYSDKQMANQYSGGSRVIMRQTQGGPWYATKADALAALHYAVAEECAAILRTVEKRIEAQQ
ncbi:hypothetical protein [Caulobacter phage KcrB]|nr:hypothetical protein RW_GP019 [Caulobacter phage RW]WCA46323.1 hypothetical protein [Caulobacter phage KcrB]WCD56258.1 hypothetical protein [Caulobacter phage RLK]WNV48050.1 hypothetical protein GB2A_gp018 [Caulobacter phage GB2A]